MTSYSAIHKTRILLPTIDKKAKTRYYGFVQGKITRITMLSYYFNKNVYAVEYLKNLDVDIEILTEVELIFEIRDFIFVHRLSRFE